LSDLKIKSEYLKIYEKQEKSAKLKTKKESLSLLKQDASGNLVKDSKKHFNALLQMEVEIYFAKDDPVQKRKLLSIDYLHEKFSKEFPNHEWSV
jgi:hypothetical protein